MVKGKISSQDFMNLLDDQEVAHETLAFTPSRGKRSKATPAGAKERKKQVSSPKVARPVEKKWLSVALLKSPAFIASFVTSDRVLKVLKTLNASLDEVIGALYEARAARSGRI